MSHATLASKARIRAAKRELDDARLSGDELKIDLAEAALNSLLEHLSSYLSQVTNNPKGKHK